MKKLVVSVASLVLIGIALIMFQRTSGPVPASTPTYQLVLADVANIENALITVAFQQKFFERHGVEVTRRTLSSGKDALATMAGGQADLAVSAETPLVWATLSGEKLTILATLNETVNKATARKSAGIDTLSKLKDKRVGFIAGTSADFWFSKVLQEQGLSKGDVRLVNLAPPNMVAAIIRNPPDIDIFFAWEPHNANAKSVLKDDAVEFSSEGTYTEFFNLSARQDFVSGNNEDLSRFLQALLDAEIFVRQNAGEAQREMSEFLGVDVAIILRLWEENTYELTLKQSLVDELDEISKWALTTGEAPPRAKPITSRLLISDDLLQQLAPDKTNTLK